MAEKKADLQRRGGPPISSIWAYEEPENNLEFASAVQLADELDALSGSGIAQIILTTHSPAFYDLGQREDHVALNFVSRGIDAEGTVIKTDASGIDESLGTLAMMGPRIAEMVAEVRAQENARAEAERLAEENCARIFVEGESDRLVLDRALALFFPQINGQVRFETKRDGGGHGYVIDMLIGWRAQHKHHPDRPKAVGIVDGDAGAEKKAFNTQPDNVRSAKCLCYPNSAPVRSALAAGFRVPATLETLYPRAVWQRAFTRGHLVNRDPSGVFPRDLVNLIIRGEARAGDALDGNWSVLVTHDFAGDRKIRTARRLCGQSDEACRTSLAAFEPLLNEALAYLGLFE